MHEPDEHETIQADTASALAALSERYEHLHELGRGGMGIVYRARDRHTGDTVAVKVLRAEVMADPQAAERFTNELLLARRITHKNICRVYEINRFGSIAAISMEYVDGRSLRALLQQVGSVSVRHGVHLISQILDGLGEAHAQGVIHRDLKPENILIDHGGRVKVMDFGIARTVDAHQTGTTVLTGTPAYMSPEQAAGKPADARSDLYALGLMMYEMFCGQRAFSAEHPIALLAKQAGEVPTRPRAIDPDMPIRIERVILRLLEKKPERRFQSAAEVQRALTGEHPAGTAPPLHAGSLPVSFVRWHHADWALLVCAVLGMLAFLGLSTATGLTSRSQVMFDRSALEQIAREYRQRLGVPPSAVTESDVVMYRSELAYVGRTAGHQQARALADAGIPVFGWSMRFADRSYLEVDRAGDVLLFFTAAPDTSLRPIAEDAARQKAEQALREWFRIEPANVTLFGVSTFGPRRTFNWETPAKLAGLTPRYTVGVSANGVETASRYLVLPAGSVVPWRPSFEGWYTPVTLVIAIALAGFGFAARRRLQSSEPWHLWLALLVGAAGLMVGASYLSMLVAGSRLGVAAAVGFTLAAGWILVSAVVDHLVTRLDARKLISLRLLFSRSAWAAPCGLSVLRGAMVGAVLLGVDALGQWVATRFLGATLDLDFHIWFAGMGLRYGGVAVLIAAVVQALWIGSFVAVAAALIHRFSARPWTGVLVAAVVLAVTGTHFSMASFSEPQFVVAQLFIDYVILALAFRRYDLLALFTAIFTFSLWASAAPLLVILEQINATGPRLLLAVWIIVVLTAAVAAFQSELQSAYRSLATKLE